MSRALQLRVAVPGGLVFDAPIQSLRARDASGAFGLRPGHEPFHTCLETGLVIIRDADGVERFIAVRHGVLWLAADEVDLVTRDAAVADALGDVERRVVEEYHRRDQQEYEADKGLRKLQLAALRQLMSYEHARVD